MKTPIHILCSTDDKYVPWCGIMLTSLFETNPGEPFVVHLLTAGLTPENTAAFKGLEKKYGSEIHFVHIDESLLEGCSIREGDTVSLATYFRLLSPRFLPQEVEKVIYLDCDIVVNGPLRPLWETDLEGYAFGAVMDESFYKDELYQRLQYPQESGYVNAGVQLINLKYWRENGCVERCLDCVLKNQEILTLYDQDAVNKVLHAEKKLVSVTYNFQHGFLLGWQYGYYQGEMKADIDACTYNPVIIHYDGRSKPWHKDSHHPYTSYFLHFKEMSQWKDTPLIGSYTLKDRWNWLVHHVMVLIGRSHPLFRIKAQKYESK